MVNFIIIDETKHCWHDNGRKSYKRSVLKDWCQEEQYKHHTYCHHYVSHLCSTSRIVIHCSFWKRPCSKQKEKEVNKQRTFISQKIIYFSKRIRRSNWKNLWLGSKKLKIQRCSWVQMLPSLCYHQFVGLPLMQNFFQLLFLPAKTQIWFLTTSFQSEKRIIMTKNGRQDYHFQENVHVWHICVNCVSSFWLFISIGSESTVMYIIHSDIAK